MPSLQYRVGCQRRTERSQAPPLGQKMELQSRLSLPRQRQQPPSRAACAPQIKAGDRVILRCWCCLGGSRADASGSDRASGQEAREEPWPTCHAVPCRATPRQSGHLCFCSALLRVFLESLQSDRCQFHLLTAPHCWRFLSPSILACSFLASLSAGCLLRHETADQSAINSPPSPTRANVQAVVRTWSSPTPTSPSSSSSPSYLDYEVPKCKQRDCRVPELTQTHHDANRMGGGEGEEGREELSSNGHKVAVRQASLPPSLRDSPYLGRLRRSRRGQTIM